MPRLVKNMPWKTNFEQLLILLRLSAAPELPPRDAGSGTPWHKRFRKITWVGSRKNSPANVTCLCGAQLP